MIEETTVRTKLHTAQHSDEMLAQKEAELVGKIQALGVELDNVRSLRNRHRGYMDALSGLLANAKEEGGDVVLAPAIQSANGQGEHQPD